MDEKNFTFLFYGLAAVWMILFAYVVSLAARDRKIKQEMDSLRRMVEDRERK